MLDAGASAEAGTGTSRLALMGRLFARDVLGSPRRASASCRSARPARAARWCWAHALLRGTPGFAGNVEGRDIQSGAGGCRDADGFTGNVVLKTMEGTAGFLLRGWRAWVDAPGRSAGCWCGPRCGGCASASTRATAARCCWASAGLP